MVPTSLATNKKYNKLWGGQVLIKDVTAARTGPGGPRGYHHAQQEPHDTDTVESNSLILSSENTRQNRAYAGR